MLTNSKTPWVCICCRHHMTFGDLRECPSCHALGCPACHSHNIYPADRSVIDMAERGLEYQGIIGTIN